MEDSKGGNEREFKADVVFVATGRRVVTKDIGLDIAKVETDKFGRIIVNEHL